MLPLKNLCCMQITLLYVEISIALLVSFFVHLTQGMVIRDEGMKTERIPLSDWPVGKSVGHFCD